MGSSLGESAANAAVLLAYHPIRAGPDLAIPFKADHSLKVARKGAPRPIAAGWLAPTAREDLRSRSGPPVHPGGGASQLWLLAASDADRHCALRPLLHTHTHC